MEPDSLLTDAQILSGCLRRDKKSWDFFVERFSDLIYWSIHQTLAKSGYANDISLAQDIFQSIFANLLEKKSLGTLEDGSSLKKFLVITAANAARDRIKSLSRWEKRSGDLTVFDPPASAHSPVDQILSDERMWVVGEAVDEFKSSERKIFECYYLDGETYEAIGNRYSLPISTVSNIVARVRDKIKTRLIKKGLWP